MYIRKILKLSKVILILGFLSVFSQVSIAATFEFSPASGSFPVGCNHVVSLIIDPDGIDSNSADIEINYDPEKIEVLDANLEIPGKQIGNGEAYDAYVTEIDETLGIIKFAGATFDDYVDTEEIFGILKFQSFPTTAVAVLEIDFDGQGITTDSNIASSDMSEDTLTNVVNGNYSFYPLLEGSCETDTEFPEVVFVDPEPFTSGVKGDDDITIQVTDNIGVETHPASLKFWINGEIYTTADSEVIYSGSISNYIFTIDPREPHYEGLNVVQVEAYDISGNGPKFSQMVFNSGNFSTPPSEDAVETGDELEEVSPTITFTPIREYQDFTKVPIGESFSQESFEREIFLEQLAKYLDILLPFLSLLGILLLLRYINPNSLWLITHSLFKKEDKYWGVVLDSSNYQPILYAKCELFYQKTGELFQKVLSDTDGKYGFEIKPGNYNLKITKIGYEDFSKNIIIENDQNKIFQDVLLSKNSLRSKENLSSRWSDVFSDIWKRIIEMYFYSYTFLLFFGFVLSVFCCLFLQTKLSLLVLGVYLLILVYQIIIDLERFLPKHAQVVESIKETRIPNSLVKIYDGKSFDLVESTLADKEGYFEFWGKSGEYLLEVVSKCHNFPSKKEDRDIVAFEGKKFLKINLKRGYNDISIYVDSFK